MLFARAASAQDAPPVEAELPSPAETVLPAPTPPTVAVANAGSSEEIPLSDWNREDWMLVKPQLSLVELDGYFRLRTYMLRKLDFGNEAATENTARYVAASGKSDGRKADFTGANMRLRVDPQINATDDIHVMMTFDVFDNLSMGSTPSSVPPSSGTPDNLGNNGQRAPEKGLNALQDSIVLKRAYASITALNEQLELRFGRMPFHWGLGMMTHNGDCLDCDYGDIVDRVSLTFKAAKPLFMPAYDWVSTGPQAAPFGRSGGQPLDAVTWDDVEQYSLRIARIEHPNVIADRLSAGDSVLNYGFWGIWRKQSRDLTADYYLCLFRR